MESDNNVLGNTVTIKIAVTSKDLSSYHYLEQVLTSHPSLSSAITIPLHNKGHPNYFHLSILDITVLHLILAKILTPHFQTVLCLPQLLKLPPIKAQT